VEEVAVSGRHESVVALSHLSKRFGRTVAVDDLSFEVGAGTVTGFLGPNGAGKTTTLRMLLGLVRPSSGTALVFGERYRDLPDAASRVGAVLEATDFHPGRTGRDHLVTLALAARLPASRVDDVLDTVELGEASRRRVGGYSLGMRQRLGLAAALLGDPELLVLDEPANGLDPEGILWIRTLLKRLAKEGRTVFLSSHLMAEMAQTAEHLVVIGRGRLIADTSVDDFVQRASTGAAVRVVSQQATALRDALASKQARVDSVERNVLEVHGLTGQEIGEVALAEKIVLAELTPLQLSLEQAFMRLTGETVEYHAASNDDDNNTTLRAAA